MGAVEAVGGRLIVPVESATVPAQLVYASTATGAPDLTAPIGSLRHSDGNTWFFDESGFGGVAALGDGRYVVCHTFQSLFVILGADGQLVDPLSTTPGAANPGALFATSSSAIIPGRNAGATVLGSNLWLVDRNGRVHTVSVGNLTNIQQGAFSTVLTGPRRTLDWVQASPAGRIAGAGYVAGLWTAPDGVRVLWRRGTAHWQVSRLTSSGGTLTVTDLYRPTTRPFRGATEIGGVLYASANNRIYRYTTARDTTVQLGVATASIEVNILARGSTSRSPGATPYRR